MRIYSNKSQRGTSSTEVLVYVGGFAIVWLIVYVIMHWIYTTKEARLDARWEAGQKMDGNKINYFDDRGPGGFQVTCRGIFRKECPTWQKAL